MKLQWSTCVICQLCLKPGLLSEARLRSARAAYMSHTACTACGLDLLCIHACLLLQQKQLKGVLTSPTARSLQPGPQDLSKTHLASSYCLQLQEQMSNNLKTLPQAASLSDCSAAEASCC